MDRTERATLLRWAGELTPEQMRPLIIEFVEHLVETEDVCIGHFSPYWEATGDRLVPGQQVWADD